MRRHRRTGNRRSLCNERPAVALCSHGGSPRWDDTCRLIRIGDDIDQHDPEALFDVAARGYVVRVMAMPLPDQERVFIVRTSDVLDYDFLLVIPAELVDREDRKGELNRLLLGVKALATDAIRWLAGVDREENGD